jgi:hypothetical protein
MKIRIPNVVAKYLELDDLGDERRHHDKAFLGELGFNLRLQLAIIHVGHIHPGKEIGDNALRMKHS